MNFRALEILSESWKSPGNLFLKKDTNPVKGIRTHDLINCLVVKAKLFLTNGMMNVGTEFY